MKTAIAMLLLCLPAPPQLGSLEKQALETVQQMQVSRLDAALPRYSFLTWFYKVVGPEAGVVWQLTECGENPGRTSGPDDDLRACTEANAILSDGRKVVVAISVGTFKKGVTGEPTFHYAVIEQDNQLFLVPRLRDLPGLLNSAKVTLAKASPIRLPVIAANLQPVNRELERGFLPSSDDDPYPYPAIPAAPEARPSGSNSEPSAVTSSGSSPAQQSAQSARPQPIREGLLRGRALTKANPAYPANAGTLDVFLRTVVVAVVVSEQGRVMSAKVIRGHPVLHTAAMEAAMKWTFEPSTFNGLPVKVESILTFVFGGPNK